MPIYMEYEDPPEPPEHLWLIIDLEKIRFNTKRDIEYVEKIIIRFNPELFTTINSMYKIYKNNLRSCLNIHDREVTPPKIMKKASRKN